MSNKKLKKVAAKKVTAKKVTAKKTIAKIDTSGIGPKKGQIFDPMEPPIPIIVVLGRNFNGKEDRIVLTESAPDLADYGYPRFWTERVYVKSAQGVLDQKKGFRPHTETLDKYPYEYSAAIHPGPSFNPTVTYEVSLCSGIDYQGSHVVLNLGSNQILPLLPFHPRSVRFKFTIQPALPTAISPIPFVIELFEDENFQGQRCFVVEDIPNLDDYCGFGNIAKSIKIYKGPNYSNDKPKAMFCSGNDGTGSRLVLAVGNYQKLNNHQISSVYMNNFPKPVIGPNA